MQFGPDENPYTYRDVQVDVFRGLLGISRSNIPPEELAFMIGDRQIDAIPPDVLLALIHTREEDRAVLFLRSLQSDLVRYAVSNPYSDYYGIIPDIARSAGAALVRLLRHDSLIIRETAVETLAALGPAAELAFVPIAILGRTGVMKDFDLAKKFESKINSGERWVFRQYKSIAENCGELKPDKFKALIQKHRDNQWWSKPIGKTVVLGGLLHKDLEVVQLSLETIATTSASPNFPSAFPHMQAPDAENSSQAGSLNWYLQIEAALALASTFILREPTGSPHRKFFLKASGALQSSPLLGVIIENDALSAIRSSDSERALFASASLYIATKLSPAEHRIRPISRLIELMNDPRPNVGETARGYLWDIQNLINNLHKSDKETIADKLIQAFKEDCQQNRDEIKCETLGDMIGLIPGIDQYLLGIFRNLARELPRDPLAKEVRKRILYGIVYNTQNQVLKLKLQKYLYG